MKGKRVCVTYSPFSPKIYPHPHNPGFSRRIQRADEEPRIYSIKRNYYYHIHRFLGCHRKHATMLRDALLHFSRISVVLLQELVRKRLVYGLQRVEEREVHRI